jgi:hypothetical protein
VLVVAAAAALLGSALPGGAVGTTTVKVDPQRVYTPTSVTVRKGDTVAISASGTVIFGAGPIANLGPEGIAWGRQCTAIANPEHRQIPWPAPGLGCWSLIARIGIGRPIAVGTSATFKAASAGRLQLGVNDNYVEDNSGSFTAQVAVTPAGSGGTTGPSGTGGGTTGTGATAGSTGSGSSSKTGLFVVIVAVVVLAAALLLFFLRRRKTDEAGEEAPGSPEPIVAPGAAVPPPPPPVLVPEPEPEPAAPGVPIAPPDPESIDVNIFEVEFVNGLQLRIGYNHFPDGTPVNWKVTQSRKPVAVGSFVAQGGGSTNHFETAALGLKLEGRDAHPDGADVQFDWSINGVPFR